MSWFWMNIPAAAVFVAAWCGIPLYMVLKHPSWCSQAPDCDERAVARAMSAAQPEHAPDLSRDVLPSDAMAGAAR
jgi:hypothetical protein